MRRYEKDGEELEHKEHGNMPEWAEDDPGKYWEAAARFAGQLTGPAGGSVPGRGPGAGGGVEPGAECPPWPGTEGWAGRRCRKSYRRRRGWSG